jgi:hypothetical protein
VAATALLSPLPQRYCRRLPPGCSDCPRLRDKSRPFKKNFTQKFYRKYRTNIITVHTYGGIDVVTKERQDYVHERHLVEDVEGDGAGLHQVPQQVQTLHQNRLTSSRLLSLRATAAAGSEFLGKTSDMQCNKCQH